MENNYLLKHNEANSLIRRQSGIDDAEWNWLIVEVENRVVASDESTSFMIELIRVLQSNNMGYSEITKNFSKQLLKALGVEKDILHTNLEHSAYRLFRHYAPENLRNAVNHSGMPFAELKYRDGIFYWESKIKLTVFESTKVLDIINAQIGDEVTIIATGEDDINSVKLVNGMDSFEYYNKSRSKDFGTTMYLLKKAITLNNPQYRKTKE